MGIGDWGLWIGDWGLGIGDWAQSPIPNPQTPIPNPQTPYIIKNDFNCINILLIYFYIYFIVLILIFPSSPKLKVPNILLFSLYFLCPTKFI